MVEYRSELSELFVNNYSTYNDISVTPAAKNVFLCSNDLKKFELDHNIQVFWGSSNLGFFTSVPL